MRTIMHIRKHHVDADGAYSKCEKKQAPRRVACTHDELTATPRGYVAGRGGKATHLIERQGNAFAMIPIGKAAALAQASLDEGYKLDRYVDDALATLGRD